MSDGDGIERRYGRCDQCGQRAFLPLSRVEIHEQALLNRGIPIKRRIKKGARCLNCDPDGGGLVPLRRGPTQHEKLRKLLNGY
jgi:hypothetical protein